MTDHEPRLLLNALMRKDLASFTARAFATVSPGSTYLPNWHTDAIAAQLERVAIGDVTRLIITMPPRSMKSIAASVAFPAWLLGKDPRKRVLAVSYAESLSEKLAFDCMKVLQSSWYEQCFPATRIVRDRRGRMDFETTKGGGRYSTSIGGAVTGRGGDIIIIDDPHKPDEAVSEVKREQVINWYRTTLLSRLNDPTSGAIVLIQQRVHEADLAGYLLEQGGWEHLDLPAIAEEPATVDLGWRGTRHRKAGDLLHPERLPADLLDQYRTELGSMVFAAQYQQRPAPRDGGLVKWAWFESYGEPPQRHGGDRIVQSWDTASKAEEASDYSVCTTWLVRGRTAFLLDLTRSRLEYPDLRKRILLEAERHNARFILIEDAGSGTHLLQELKRSTSLNIYGIRPKDDKATRLMSVSPIIEAGRVMIPAEASWLATFRREITLFPNSKHDDQVDSVTQFLSWLDGRRKQAMWGTYG